MDVANEKITRRKTAERSGADHHPRQNCGARTCKGPPTLLHGSRSAASLLRKIVTLAIPKASGHSGNFQPPESVGAPLHAKMEAKGESYRAPMAPSPNADVLIVVPARYASSRFPGKPLTPIAGRPMIQHVVDR